ncbi:MAG: PEP-CTERM sorting domain-containing protein [Fimbriimonadaceae bacterium]|nr:PEP-CTERM sorting domain-containing protein [Fimbriimonadaceae bacterium]
MSIQRFTLICAASILVGSAFAQDTLPVGGGTGVPVVPVPNLDILAVKASSYDTTTIDGTLTSIVARETGSTDGSLIFAWFLQSAPTSTSTVGRFTTNGWAGFGADVAQHDATALAGSFGNIVASADRFNADTLGFNFDRLGANALVPGSTSTVFWAKTFAPDWTDQTAFVIDGAVASVDTFAPVPEPGTLALLGGAAALAAWRRRRKA